MNSGAMPTWLWMFIAGRYSLAPPVVDIRLFSQRHYSFLEMVGALFSSVQNRCLSPWI